MHCILLQTDTVSSTLAKHNVEHVLSTAMRAYVVTAAALARLVWTGLQLNLLLLRYLGAHLMTMMAGVTRAAMYGATNTRNTTVGANNSSREPMPDFQLGPVTQWPQQKKRCMLHSNYTAAAEQTVRLLLCRCWVQGVQGRWRFDSMRVEPHQSLNAGTLLWFR